MSETALSHSHHPQDIRSRLSEGKSQVYIKDLIYGAIDGAITTFAIVSGVAGAGLSIKIVLVMGIANLIADGFSMGISNFLGTRAENQRLDQLRKVEAEHIEKAPEGEREEIRQIFAAKGFEGKNLEHVVEVITSEKKRWIDTMLQEEYGLSLDKPSAFRAGMATFFAFIVAGSIPLLFYIWHVLRQSDVNPNAIFINSCIATGFTFLLIGIAKGRYLKQGWLKSGLETLIIGSVAAAMAYLIGMWLEGLGG